MRRGKWVILVVMMALAVIGASTATVLARTARDGSGPADIAAQVTTDGTQQSNSLTSRVAAILGIEESTVQAAFTQAQQQLQDEALELRLSKLVEQGKLTQEQADQLKAWYKARPDVPQGRLLPGGPWGPALKGGFGHGLPRLRGFGGRHWAPSFTPTPAPGTST